jgi:CzcA family heavy metal efflux pump
MKAALHNRLITVVATAGLCVLGVWSVLNMPVDVFPDLTAPTVTILTEAHGMAPEEIEKLVTFPIETVVNGASGVRRVRSNSIQGLSTVWVEFDWGEDIYRARQIVAEKLQIVRNALPPGVDQPVLAPITSIMGEIMLVGLTAERTTPKDLRTIGEYEVARRIQSVPGVSQVLVYGGEVKQFQVLLDPHHLFALNITLQEATDAVRACNVNATGGVLVESGQEHLIRGLGRVSNLDDIKNTVVTTRDGIPLRLRDIAVVQEGSAFRIGTASIDQQDGVLLVVAKQPEANTLQLTRTIERVLSQVEESLPADVVIRTDIFQQADFISRAIDNVIGALRDGSILVILVLWVFLVNVRTTAISALAIPVSLIVAFLTLRLLGMTIDTMTLGGMAIAIGVLVDDAVIYVENVYRRIRQNAEGIGEPQRPFIEVVAAASAEVRTPITVATFIVIIVFVPLFFLSGVEGRMLRPLGISYVTAILASLLVAITLTPALSVYLLKNVAKSTNKESWLVVRLKDIYAKVLETVLHHRGTVIALSSILVILALASGSFLGRSFLPEFNEGTFNISLVTKPGTSLEESDQIGRMVEGILLSNDAVVSTARRTGRTESDEHSLGSHAHELEVQLDLSSISKPDLLAELREALAIVPGTNITIGQPISHRIDHMLSGTRAAIAVKLFGPELYQLRRLADQIKGQMESVDGVVDLYVDQQTEVSQIRIEFDRQQMSLYGLRPADLDSMIDVAFKGEVVSQVYEGEYHFDLAVRYAPEFRNSVDALRKSLIDTPLGSPVPLERVAHIYEQRGPNYIQRENVRRKLVIQANVAGRDLNGAVQDIRRAVTDNMDMPAGYFVEYGGQFESEQRASRTIMILSLFSFLAILIMLYMEFGNLRQAVMVMANLPLALIGGIVSVFLTGGVLSIATLVGFITLFGIAVRNGILMVSHYNYLMEHESRTVHQAVVQGSLERLSPILMTALTTGLALVPLALAGHKPGAELEAPMAIVILGGLFSAVLLNLVVVPALYSKWGRG